MSELNQLIENSRINESISKKLFAIETEVLSCQSSHELLKHLLGSIKDKFNLTGIHLLLVEPTPLSYLLNGNLQSDWHKQNTRQISYEHLSLYHKNNKPYLTNDLTQIATIIPKSLLTLTKSAALTPLTLEDKLFGSLLFTDNDEMRFHPELGTYHLEQLAVKISLCLSNVLIREQLEYMANYDRLTGVANRRLMEITINEELIRQRRYGVPFSLLFIDCDKFKEINDTYGHDCGDKVLSYVASQLQELIRENDRCFRYAGDEFVITLASQTYEEALAASKRLCHFFVNNPMPYQGKLINITISCGAAECEGNINMDALLKKADLHLYKNKAVLSVNA
ncbi:MAG: diguanylate cyclase (GGDEF)-like protein [Alteromonadaceae bacterium]|jgi:diguanylate cyclase (GGDEF)-like protein